MLAFFMFNRTRASAFAVFSAWIVLHSYISFMSILKFHLTSLTTQNSFILPSFFHISWFRSTCYLKLPNLYNCPTSSNRISMTAGISISFKSPSQWSSLTNYLKFKHLYPAQHSLFLFTAFLQYKYHHLIYWF